MVEVYGVPEETVRKLNVLCDALAAGAYQPGARNNIAVDLSILCYELGIEPLHVFDMVLPEADHDDRLDLIDRLSVLDSYLYVWNQYGIEGYMLGDWEGCGEEPKKEWIRLAD